MSQQSMTSLTPQPTTSSRPIAIGRGNHGAVQLDPETMIVSKRLTLADPERTSELVQREYQYLSRFSAALDGLPFVRCPVPVSVEPEQGIVRMTYCPGERLDHALVNANDDVLSHVDHIASQIGVAMRRYVQEFGEPYFSLSTNNMVYDPETKILSLIDFTSSREFPGIDLHAVPYDVTLGCYLGVTTYHTVRVRPPAWKDRGYWKRQKRLSDAVADALAGIDGIAPEVVREIADITYRTLAINGRPMRRLWYSTMGRALFAQRRGSVIRRLSPDPVGAG